MATDEQANPQEDLSSLEKKGFGLHLEAHGIPANLDTIDAMGLFMMVGARLRTVEKRIRPALKAEIRNMGERWRKEDGNPTVQSVLIHMLIASWENTAESDEGFSAAFSAALRRAQKGSNESR